MKLALVLGGPQGQCTFDETPSSMPPDLFRSLISSSGFENSSDEVYPGVEVAHNITKGSAEVKVGLVG